MIIDENIHLKKYNTFQIDCITKYFITIQNTQDLIDLMQTEVFQKNKYYILGGGANVLFTKENFDGLIIKNKILGKEIIEEDETSITIKVGGGEDRPDFVRRAIDQGYCGLENLVSIPGSVGASPMQNIGAYGTEVQSIIQSIECIRIVRPIKEVNSSEQRKDLSGGSFTLSNKQCNFGYRTSIFKTDLKNQIFITHVTFKLQKYNPDTYNPNISYGAIQEKVDENEITPKLLAKTISGIRSSRLPNRKELGTAGSFFKNPIIPDSQFQKLLSQFPELKGFPVAPISKGKELEIKVKLFAGQLIDLTGLKDLTQGNVGIYKKHALILVNYGGGTGSEIQKLAEYIISQVHKKFGIQLEPEVNYV